MVDEDIGPEPLTVLTESFHAHCSVYSVYKQRCKYLKNGREGDFYVMQCPDWVQVLALTPERNIVLVKQYRVGIRDFQLETPGGGLNPDESPEAGAARELLEETGYAGSEAVHLGFNYPNPALQNNKVHYVCIHNCMHQAKPSQDPMEDIQAGVYSLEEAFAMLKEGVLQHALVVNAFYFLQNYLAKTHDSA